MSEHPICNWIGASGTPYKFYIWEIPANFSPNQNGNYIYAKKNSEGKWVPIYIGQGDLKDRSENHPKQNCISSNGCASSLPHLTQKCILNTIFCFLIQFQSIIYEQPCQSKFTI
jgi:hypothetical protein